MVSRDGGSRQKLLPQPRAAPRSRRPDQEEGGSDSGSEEKNGGLHFGVWLITALVCAVLAMFCAVWGLSIRDAADRDREAVPEDRRDDMEHRPENGLLTNAEDVKWFRWNPTTRTAESAILDTFRFGAGWANARFREGPDQAMTVGYVAEWVTDELLGLSPFGRENEVPVPWSSEPKGQQLGMGQYVGYTRRQVCYIVAKSLLGAGTRQYDNFLVRYLEDQSCDSASNSVGRSRRVAMWNLLAACAADPLLKGGGQGPLLLVVKAAKAEDVEKLHQIASYAPLEGAGMRVCRYDDGFTDLGDHVYPEGQTGVPQEGCIPPAMGGPGRDFLTGGLRYQAVQAISFGDFSGRPGEQSLSCSGSWEHERLLVYMPEAAALMLFLSTEKDGPTAEWPFWLLGARRLMIGIDGTGRYDLRLELDLNVSMSSDLEKVFVNGSEFELSSSRPLLAFAGVSLDSLNMSGIPEADWHHEVSLARRNRNRRQRDAASFDLEVQAWYNAMALTSYDELVRPAMRKLVRSLGTGPWLSAHGWGDSQLGFLAMWIAHSMAAQTWDDERDGRGDCADAPCLPLDYYVYSDFGGNPGNQCLVHAAEECRQCLGVCRGGNPATSVGWLPPYAHMGAERNETCVLDEPGDCGKKSFKDVMSTYTKNLASSLWDRVKAAMKTDANRSVFDLLLLYNIEE